jgi:hypothetical protein
MIDALDEVVLTCDLPDNGLAAGDIGTVVLVHDEGKGYEVEPGRELRRQRARVVAPVKQLRHRGPPREVGAEIANQWWGGNHGRESTPGRDNPGPGVSG